MRKMANKMKVIKKRKRKITNKMALKVVPVAKGKRTTVVVVAKILYKWQLDAATIRSI